MRPALWQYVARPCPMRRLTTVNSPSRSPAAIVFCTTGIAFKKPCSAFRRPRGSFRVQVPLRGVFRVISVGYAVPLLPLSLKRIQKSRSPR